MKWIRARARKIFDTISMEHPALQVYYMLRAEEFDYEDAKILELIIKMFSEDIQKENEGISEKRVLARERIEREAQKNVC